MFNHGRAVLLHVIFLHKSCMLVVTVDNVEAQYRWVRVIGNGYWLYLKHISLYAIYRYACIKCFISLAPSLYSVLSNFLSFTRPILSGKDPPCKPGPAQGFFRLKGSFSLPLCLPGGSGSGFLTL